MRLDGLFTFPSVPLALIVCNTLLSTLSARSHSLTFSTCSDLLRADSALRCDYLRRRRSQRLDWTETKTKVDSPLPSRFWSQSFLLLNVTRSVFMFLTKKEHCKCWAGVNRKIWFYQEYKYKCSDLNIQNGRRQIECVVHSIWSISIHKSLKE